MRKISTSRLLKSDGTAVDIGVNATANIWTKSLKMSYGNAFAVSLRAKSSTGTPDLDIYLEQTHIDPASVSTGTGEGVVGDNDNGWVIPAGSSKLIDITDEAWHHFVVSPLSLPYMRLLLDGQGTSPADTTVEIWVSEQEA